MKGGGHTTNPGFSSTPGVQIALSSFTDIHIDFPSRKVDVGSGLTWDSVYKKLESSGLGVVGGRLPGVGVAGVTLGGGECLRYRES